MKKRGYDDDRGLFIFTAGVSLYIFLDLCPALKTQKVKLVCSAQIFVATKSIWVRGSKAIYLKKDKTCTHWNILYILMYFLRRRGQNIRTRFGGSLRQHAPQTNRALRGGGLTFLVSLLPFWPIPGNWILVASDMIQTPAAQPKTHTLDCSNTPLSQAVKHTQISTLKSIPQVTEVDRVLCTGEISKY